MLLYCHYNVHRAQSRHLISELSPTRQRKTEEKQADKTDRKVNKSFTKSVTTGFVSNVSIVLPICFATSASLRSVATTRRASCLISLVSLLRLLCHGNIPSCKLYTNTLKPFNYVQFSPLIWNSIHIFSPGSTFWVLFQKHGFLHKVLVIHIAKWKQLGRIGWSKTGLCFHPAEMQNTTTSEAEITCPGLSHQRNHESSPSTEGVWEEKTKKNYHEVTSCGFWLGLKKTANHLWDLIDR